MPKDYAKTPRNRTRQRTAPPKSTGKLWVLAVVLLALFIMALAYLKQQTSGVLQKQTVQEKPVKAVIHEQHPAKSTTVTPPAQPHFDFYTILPKNQTSAPSTPAPTNNTQSNTLPSESYTLQLGEFKDFAAADQLKAQVVLQGFEVKIDTVKKENVTIYRVWTGPYPTRTEAHLQQKNLEENQIKSEIIKE